MSFYTLSTGKKAEGTAEKANLQDFKLIPDGTHAPATIKEFKLVEAEGDYDKHYLVVYQIIDGEFKNQLVRHKIKAFESEAKKRDRHIEMIMRLFRIANFKPTHEMTPTTEDVCQCQGANLGIVVGEWQSDGRFGNFVRATFPLTDEFEVKTGEYLPKQEVTQSGDLGSAFSRAKQNNDKFDDSDLPF